MCLPYINAFQYPGQLGNVNLQTSTARRSVEFFERAFFQHLIPQDKSRPVPEQNLAFIARLVEKDKQMAAEQVGTHKAFGQHGQFMEPAPHIRRLGIDKDLDRRWQRQYKSASPNAENTADNVCRSTPAGIFKV